MSTREIPISFSAPMVRALLDGRKTQTRRTVKPQPVYRTDTVPAGWEFDPGDGGLYKWPELEGFTRAMQKFCPYGEPGDRLWVREPFFDTSPVRNAPLFADRTTRYAFEADGEFIGCHKWKPPIRMPRAASRILLEVTAGRIEQLRDITVSDAIREGYDAGNADPVDPSIKWFSALWESINGAGSWAANPWVWVIEFRRVPS